jgi:hypothetical protein
MCFSIAVSFSLTIHGKTTKKIMTVNEGACTSDTKYPVAHLQKAHN